MSDDISIPSPTYRVPRHRRGMDPATRKLAMIAAAIGGGFLLVMGGWTMLSHRSHGVPVVQADSSPVRVKPANPGGLQVAGAGNEIFSGGSDTAVEKLGPAAETPDPQALRAPPPPPKPAPLAAVEPAPFPAPAPLAITPPAPRPAIAAAPPKVAAAPLPAPAPSPAVAHAAGGRVLVQLAALSSEQAAKAEWDHLAKRLPDLLGSRQPNISRIERAGHTFWRVRTGGFGDVAQATLFCERLRAKSAGCSVAEF